MSAASQASNQSFLPVIRELATADRALSTVEAIASVIFYQRGSIESARLKSSIVLQSLPMRTGGCYGLDSDR